MSCAFTQFDAFGVSVQCCQVIEVLARKMICFARVVCVHLWCCQVLPRLRLCMVRVFFDHSSSEHCSHSAAQAQHEATFSVIGLNTVEMAELASVLPRHCSCVVHFLRCASQLYSMLQISHICVRRLHAILLWLAVHKKFTFVLCYSSWCEGTVECVLQSGRCVCG